MFEEQTERRRVAAVDEAAVKVLLEALVAERGMAAEGRAADEWELLLRSAFCVVHAAPVERWPLGVTSWEQRALGPRVFIEVQGPVRVSGGAGRWQPGLEVDGEVTIGDDGYVLGWQLNAATMVEAVSFDEWGMPHWRLVCWWLCCVGGVVIRGLVVGVGGLVWCY